MEHTKRKTNGYNSTKLQARRAQRREEAAERNAVYQNLTVEQRISAIQRRRGNSRKELERITHALNAQKKVVIPPEQKTAKPKTAKPKTVKKKATKKKTVKKA